MHYWSNIILYIKSLLNKTNEMNTTQIAEYIIIVLTYSYY